MPQRSTSVAATHGTERLTALVDHVRAVPGSARRALHGLVGRTPSAGPDEAVAGAGGVALGTKVAVGLCVSATAAKKPRPKHAPIHVKATASPTPPIVAQLDKLQRVPLLIVDEVGYIPFDPHASNKPFSAWGEIFGDEVTAAAMIDRLVHHAEVLALKGDSYRLKDRDLARPPVEN